MQIDFGVISMVVSLAVGVFAWLAKYAVSGREDATEKRFTDLEVIVRDVNSRLVAEEKLTIRQQGELNLVNHTHSDLKTDVDTIKSQMLTRNEFEPRMSSLEKTITNFMSEIKVMMPRFSSSGFQAPIKK
jgi:hypothetical protein